MTETITFEQVGDVLALAAARDQRTVGDGDILAWHDDLNAAHVTYDDARAALTRFYVEQAALAADLRFRATSPDVIRLARKIRDERLTNFVYEPPVGETDPHYLTRLRAQQKAIASGYTPPAVHAPALEGPPHPKMNELLSGIGRSVPDGNDDEPAPAPAIRRPGPLGIECPTCHAPIGRPCKTGLIGSGKRKELRRPHAARGRVAAGGPAHLETPEEIEARRQASLVRLAELATAERQASDGSVTAGEAS